MRSTPSRGLSLRLLAGAFAAWVAWSPMALAEGTAPGSAEPRSPYQPFDEMSRVLLMIEHDYVEPAERDKLLGGALRGMVSELDPHSSYMDPKEFAEFQSDTEGTFAGIGIEVDIRDDVVTILAPIPGSPAERGGLRPGDRILAVNGRVMRDSKIDRIVTLMRGEPGTTVRLTIGREGAEEPLAFEIVREIVHVASVEEKRLDRGVLYVRLKQFQETTHEELLRAVGRARRASTDPIRGLVLDLRWNPGGLVDQAELVADELLSEGVIYTTRHRGRVLDLVTSTPGGALSDVPCVVLVNEYTASAAELLSGALQDNGRAQILGAVTFGKGSVQTIFELPGGSGLRLTTMRYYTPNGRAIQAQGIDPDVLVVPAKRVEAIREGDLEGHLDAEGRAAPRAGQVVVTAPESKSPPSLRVSELPLDPSQGSDFALAQAFERVSKPSP